MNNGNRKREPILGSHAVKGGGAILIVGGVLFLLQSGMNFMTGPAQSCHSLAPEVLKMAKENDKLGEARLIDIVEISAKEKDGYKLECAGLGIFSNTTKHAITFRQTEEYGKLWISYVPSL